MRPIAVALMMTLATVCWAQQPSSDPVPAPAAELRERTDEPAEAPARHTVTVPAGTKLVLALKHAISTKSAHPGDAVYAETTFPVALNSQLLIPPGSYVQGTITSIKRPGRIKGRAEVLMHFTTLIFPNGYTVMLPGALDMLPGAERQKVKDPEGTLQQEGERGKDAATVAKTAGAGATIAGATSRTVKGAAIGGGIGAAAGMAISLLTRGSDLRLEQGTAIEMVLQRSIQLDEARAFSSLRR